MDIRKLMTRTSETTTDHTEELTQLENVIATGLAHFHAAGRALKAIKERKLFAPKYGSFSEYANERWGLSLPHVTRLMEAADIVDQLQAAGATKLPAIESHARVLARIEPEQRPAIWNEALEKVGDNPTAEQLDKAVEHLVPRKPKRGRKVPKAIKLKGKGWTLVLTRKSHDVDAVAVLNDCINQLDRKAAAA